jgi:hypothetical protein
MRVKGYWLARRREDQEPLFLLEMLPDYLEPTFKTLDEYRENFQGFIFQELKDSEAETYIVFGSLPVLHVWHLLTDLLDNDGIFNHT